jgi:hypothetical protein
VKVRLVVRHPDAFAVISKLIDFLLKLKGEIDEGS